MAEISAPEITVVIPCYNAAPFIARAIDSVLRQAEAAPEVVVIDDGSTDRSLDVVRGFGSQIRFSTGENRGGGHARNTGLRMARAPHVLFLDADDFHQGPMLRSLVDELQRGGGDLAIGPCAFASANRRPVPRTLPRTSGGREFLIDWLTGRWLPPAAIAWRTGFIREIGGWREDVKRNQDGELVYRAIRNGARLVAAENGTAVYWQHNSPTRINRVKNEASLAGSIMVFRELVEGLTAAQRTDGEMRDALSYASHAIERHAAVHGLENARNEIAGIRAHLGYPRYHGSMLRRLGSSAFGLETAERATLFWQRGIGRLKRLIG